MPAKYDSMPAELWRWDAATLAAAIRDRKVSSAEVVRACLDRLDAVNPAIHAVVSDLRDEALAAALAADAVAARGQPLGPLHGVPVTTKVTDDQAGHPTTSGVVAYRDRIAREDSPAIRNLRAAGAIVVGRTNSPAFGYSWWTANDLHGTTLNPWSKDHTPGGSSGGASAATAAGVAPIAQGTDMIGSIRYPAYCTGLFGLRPSFGRVPRYNATAEAEPPLSSQIMATAGPLARTVRDIRLALEVLSGGDPRDPWWTPAPLEGPPVAMPIRVAMSIDPARIGVHPAVRAALAQAGKALEQAGYVVEERDPPEFAAVAAALMDITRHETPHFFGTSYERHGDDRLRTTYRRVARASSPPELVPYMEALARRTTWIRRWNTFLADWPIVLCPTACDPPYPQDVTRLGADGYLRMFQAMMPSYVVPLLGFPGLAVPTGVADGLPTGVQLIAARFREDLVLGAAEVIEASAPMPTPIDPRS